MSSPETGGEWARLDQSQIDRANTASKPTPQEKLGQLAGMVTSHVIPAMSDLKALWDVTGEHWVVSLDDGKELSEVVQQDAASSGGTEYPRAFLHIWPGGESGSARVLGAPTSSSVPRSVRQRSTHSFYMPLALGYPEATLRIKGYDLLWPTEPDADVVVPYDLNEDQDYWLLRRVSDSFAVLKREDNITIPQGSVFIASHGFPYSFAVKPSELTASLELRAEPVPGAPDATIYPEKPLSRAEFELRLPQASLESIATMQQRLERAIAYRERNPEGIGEYTLDDLARLRPRVFRAIIQATAASADAYPPKKRTGVGCAIVSGDEVSLGSNTKLDDSAILSDPAQHAERDAIIGFLRNGGKHMDVIGIRRTVGKDEQADAFVSAEPEHTVEVVEEGVIVDGFFSSCGGCLELVNRVAESPRLHQTDDILYALANEDMSKVRVVTFSALLPYSSFAQRIGKVPKVPAASEGEYFS